MVTPKPRHRNDPPGVPRSGTQKYARSSVDTGYNPSTWYKYEAAAAPAAVKEKERRKRGRGKFPKIWKCEKLGLSHLLGYFARIPY